MAQRFSVEFGVFALLLSVAAVASAADQSSTISGVVRDASGTPQMGALVQIVSSDTIVRAAAFTDPQGRYRIQRVLPGIYGVRASAALFVPVSRNNLRLQPNRRAIVNLTLSGLLDQFSWLPARPKAADESSDDWNWTLRSSASRPMLKLAGSGISGESRRREGHPSQSVTSRVKLTSGSNTFGDSARRISVRSARVLSNGSADAISGSLGNAEASASARSTGNLSTIVERRLPSGALLASRVEYQSHPEISFGANGAGLSSLTISSAEKFSVGDFAEIEAGNLVQAFSGPGTVMASRPFLHVSAHVGPGLAVTYSLSTCRDVSDYDSAIWREAVLPRAAYLNGHMELEKGRHQEIAVSHRTHATMVALAFYADALDRIAVSGGGASNNSSWAPVSNSLMGSPSFLVDQGNGSFQTLTDGYSNSGVNILFSREVGENTWIALQYSTGSGMTLADRQASKLQGDIPFLHARRGQSATVSLRASVARTSTKVRVSYHWQPGVFITPIDPYDVLGSGDYLSVHLRQPVRFPGVFSDGVEITVDGTNMLAQGYERFVGRNGRPLYLAAAPASLRAGLAFNF